MLIDNPRAQPDAAASAAGSPSGPGSGPGSATTARCLEICRRTIDEVIGAWRARHLAAVAELTLDSPSRDIVRVGGHVLVPSQAAALERALRASLDVAGLCAGGLRFEVGALTESKGDATWLQPRERWIDVLAAPGRPSELATQWAREEPRLRFLTAHDGWFAVELADRTVGWVPEAEVEVVARASLRPDSVERWRAAWSGQAGTAPAGARSWNAALSRWLDAPYRLGGRRHEGIDCSGLTQRVYADVLGLGLPRHSKDQVRFGERVGRFDLAAGDLVYATHAERGLSHVAFVVVGVDAVDGGVPSVGHAGLDHGRVVEEPLSSFLQRYVFRAARRFPPGFRPEDPRPRPVAGGTGAEAGAAAGAAAEAEAEAEAGAEAGAETESETGTASGSTPA